MYVVEDAIHGYRGVSQTLMVRYVLLGPFSLLQVQSSILVGEGTPQLTC